MEQLAINGGKPVRTKPFPSWMAGASLIGKEELNELTEVVNNQSPFRFYGIQNPNKVEKFEAAIRSFFKVKYALGVSSGTGALLCAIAALGIGPGDEVILPAFAWYSDYCSLIAFGITPIFADIGDDLNIDPVDFEKKITAKTKAIIVVHYQGMPAKIKDIVSIAQDHRLVIIEDCAQAFGGEYDGQKLGTFGDISIASFQTHKIITAGEGGLVFTNNEVYFERAVRYHDLGFFRNSFIKQLEHPELADPSRFFAGVQLRMSELTGGFLYAQFDKLSIILSSCRNTHKILRENLKSNPNFTIRYRDGDCGIALIFLVKDKTKVKQFSDSLAAEGIPCGPTSACCNLVEKKPIRNKQLVNPNMPPFGKGFEGEGIIYEISTACPHTNDIIEQMVSIGIGPLYGKEEIDDILKAVAKVSAVIF